MMRLTACILCYQQADIIGDTIEAALNQSRLPDEVLVVDDGSEDGSADVARSCSAVRLLRHEANLGRTAARNTLLAAATGDIVVYLDGDSIAEPTLFETLLAEYGIQAWDLIREAFSGCGADLIRRRDLELARISMAVVPVKWRAVHRAMRTIRSGAA